MRSPVLTAVILLTVCRESSAAPLLLVDAFAKGFSQCSTLVESSQKQTCHAEGSDLNSFVVGDAVAQPGSIAVAAIASAIASPDLLDNLLGATASARFFANDLLISGPMTQSGTIDAIFHLVYSQNEDITTGVGRSPTTISSRSAGFGYVNLSASVGSKAVSGGRQQCQQLGPDVGPWGTGLLACEGPGDGTVWTQHGFTDDWNFTYDPSLRVTLPINQLTDLSFEISVKAYGHAQMMEGFGRASGWAAIYTHSLSLPVSDSVFILPDGYTANSVDAGITNNRWVGFQEPPTTIPEPASMFLLGSGLLGFAARRQLKRKR